VKISCTVLKTSRTRRHVWLSLTAIYYQNVNMKQRHVAYPIFHVEDMTKTDSCESSVIPEPQKPSLTTTPATTEDDTVEVEVNGEDGTTVFVNGVDSGKTIDSTGKLIITLDTSGEAGDKNFSINLKDDKGNESDALTFVIEKKITHNNNKIWDFSVEENYISQYETKTAIRHDGIAILRGYDTLRNSSNGTYNGSYQGRIYSLSFEGLRLSHDSWYNKNRHHAHYKNGSNYNFTKMTYKIESEDGYAIAYLADGTSLVWNKANHWQGYSVGDTIEYYPQKHLPTDKPYIELKKAKNFTSSLVSFDVTYGANNEGTVKYQVSTDDGTTWKYWDGSAWTVTTQIDGTETSNDSDINANVRTLDTDGGNFKWIAYLESDGNQKVELDKIEITFY
jgi:hypothetical protein